MIRPSDEVENCQAVFSLGLAQSTAELLQEDCCTLCWPEEEHRVDLREVEAFVEEVDREQDVHLPLYEPPARRISHVARRISGDRKGRKAMFRKPFRHELCVLHRCAEAKSTHVEGV